MKNDLELFSLRHRIFLVKQFYQELGNFACVKNNYEDYYGGCSDSPLFSRDVLIEIIRLFEETGSVLKCPIIPVGGAKLEDSPLEIELVCVKTEMECADGKSEEADVKSEDDGEDFPEASFASPHPSETSLNSPKELCEVIEEDPAKTTEILEDDEDDEDIKADPEECDTKGMEVDGGHREMPKEPTVTQSLFVSCVICNHQCLRRELIKHMKSHEKKRRHTAKKLICEFCGKFFANFSRLDQHQTCHMDTKRYKCQFNGCNESFKWLSSYQRHKETHAEQKKEHLKFKCEMCMKSFLYLSNLRRHIANSHDTGVRYTCEFCSKEFRKKQKLLTHMKIHDGGMPLSEVGRAPKNSGSARNVAKCAQQQRMKRSYPNEKFLRRHMDRHNGKRHQCPLCNVDYKDKSQLKIHVDKVHSKNDPPLKCERCGKCSWSIKDHRVHMRNRHKIEIPYLRKKPQQVN
uniref:C2H2-type domain-containing protein n=2 Tax=Lutzomyia longipalpis TaxID=7200 RepID=A0A1B0CV51_LUTLO